MYYFLRAATVILIGGGVAFWLISGAVTCNREGVAERKADKEALRQERQLKEALVFAAAEAWSVEHNEGLGTIYCKTSGYERQGQLKLCIIRSETVPSISLMCNIEGTCYRE